MFENWSEPLTEEERDASVEKLTSFVKKRKLEVPAILFLESHRPLGNIASHAGIAFAPFLIPFLGYENVTRYTKLFQDRSNFDLILNQLDGTCGASIEKTDLNAESNPTGGTS